MYRTLPLLTASGLVREMDFGGDRKFYDPNYADHPNHSHIICQECGAIVEFDSERIKKLEGELCRKLGFSVKAHRLQITGNCQEFKRLGTCARMNPMAEVWHAQKSVKPGERVPNPVLEERQRRRR